jgi:hypothetical protein
MHSVQHAILFALKNRDQRIVENRSDLVKLPNNRFSICFIELEQG